MIRVEVVLAVLTVLVVLADLAIAWVKWTRRATAYEAYESTNWSYGNHNEIDAKYVITKNSNAEKCPKGYKQDKGMFRDRFCIRKHKKDKYVMRDLVNGSWKCPTGYTDTGMAWDSGDLKGKLQCKKLKKGIARKKVRKAQRMARKKCGTKPSTSSAECTMWKCRKNTDTGSYDWVCAGEGSMRYVTQSNKEGAPTVDTRMGCSTDGTNFKEVTWKDGSCRQGNKSFGVCKCCEGPPGNMHLRQGAPGYATCPGKGKTECDGC